MRSFIIGEGEIGRSLWNVIGGGIAGRHGQNTPESMAAFPVDILHICFPYSDEFESEVKRYQDLYKPKYTVIHSTVKPGTSRKLNAIHSPVIGIHPELSQSLKTFTKFLGGEQASEVAQFFRRAGMKVYLFDSQETTELMKILDTSFYGVCIEYTKEVKRLCKQMGVPFEAWTIWTQVYNLGYQKLGHHEFIRPNLVPIMTQIGGHCVLPNAKMIDSKFLKLISELNDDTETSSK